MLKSTANLLFRTKYFFDEIDYHPSSSQLNIEDIMSKILFTINHTKAFNDTKNFMSLLIEFLRNMDKINKKIKKYPDFWDSIEYSGKELINIVNDEEAIGTYFITNVFPSDEKSIMVSSESLENEAIFASFTGGYFGLCEDANYYLHYSKLSSNKMIIADKNKCNVATIVLNDALGITFDSNKTKYELKTYDIGIAIFEKDYIDSLKNKEPDLDKHCKGFIQWDIIDKKGDCGFSRLEVYDCDGEANLELMIMLATSCFLLFKSHLNSRRGNAALSGVIAANMLRSR